MSFNREFAEGERRFKRDAIAAAAKITNREMMGVEGKLGDVPIDPGGFAGRFSTTYRPDLSKLDFNQKRLSGGDLSKSDSKSDMNRQTQKSKTLPALNGNKEPQSTPGSKKETSAVSPLPDINKSK